MTNLSDLILTVPVFLLAISFHEYAHALVAVKLGDPTPKLQGRLTLNFLAHFSWLGALMLLIAGIGWAKPVQVMQRNFRNPLQGMVWVSIAGPLANLVLAFAFAVVLRGIASFLVVSSIGHVVGTLLAIGVRLNVLLAVFNLIPVPPLDGAKVVTPFLPRQLAYRLESIEPWGFVVIYVLFSYFGLGRLVSTISFNIAQWML